MVNSGLAGNQNRNGVERIDNIEVLKEEVSNLRGKIETLKTRFYIYLAPMIFFVQESLRRQDEFEGIERFIFVLCIMIIGFVMLTITLSKSESKPYLSNSLDEYYHTNLHTHFEEYHRIRNIFWLMQVICVLLYTHLTMRFAFPEVKFFLIYLQLDVTFLFLASLVIILFLATAAKFYESNNYQEIDYGRSLNLNVFYLYVLSYAVQLWHFIVFVLIANIKILDDWLVCGTFIVNTGFVAYSFLRRLKIKESDKFKMEIKLSSWKFIGYFVFWYIIIYIFVAGYRFIFPKEISFSNFCILRALAVLAFLSPSIALAFNYEETIGLLEGIQQFFQNVKEFYKRAKA